MGLVITNSPDISFLDFLILYDISGGIPSITLTNQSISKTSPPDGLANCTWWYTINTPSGVSIHAGSQLNPDVTDADWTTLTIPANSWPTPFGTPPYGQIEFSCGVPYIAVLYVIDSDNNIYSLQKQVTICRPNGNTETSKGNFGAGKVLLLTNCEQAQIRGTDTTDYTYQKIVGTSQSSTWTLAYPMNANGQIPDPFVVINKPSVIFPVGFNAPGYQLYMNTYSTYNMGDGQFIKIQYKFLSVFSVWCNVNMCNIQCEIDKLYAQIIPNCGTLENAAIEKQLFLIGVLMDKCIVGIQQPLCGIDVPATIEEIKKIGKFTCDCGCDIGEGINSIGNNSGPIVIDTATTGAITASVTNAGANYTIHLAVPGASSIPDLQQVTDQGPITNVPITVGVAGAQNAQIESDRFEQQQSNTEVLSGLGRYQGADTWGSIWLRKIGQGVVIFRPHAASNTYVLIFPASQGGSNTYLKNDGAGNLSWAAISAAIGTLQQTTDAGNVTTDPIVLGSSLGVNATLSSTQLMLFNIATQLIGFLMNGPIPTLRIGGATSGFVNIVASGTTVTHQYVLPPAQGGANTFLRNDGAGNLTWNPAGGVTVYVMSADANFTIPTANSILLIEADGITADRTITLPAASDGDRVTLVNTVLNYPLHNFLLNITVSDYTNPSFSYNTLRMGVTYQLVKLGAQWYVTNVGGSAGQHLRLVGYKQGAAPTIAPGTGAGTSPTVSVSAASTDLNGVISVTTGSAPAASATIATITFAIPYKTGAVQTILVFPANTAANELQPPIFVPIAGNSGNSFNIASGTVALTGSTAYFWYYVVIGGGA